MWNFNITKMKTAVNIILAFLSAILCIAIVSCEKMMGNYLEKPPGVDADENLIFSSKNNAEAFLMGIYKDGMYTDLPEWNDRNGRRDAAFG